MGACVVTLNSPLKQFDLRHSGICQQVSVGRDTPRAPDLGTRSAGTCWCVGREATRKRASACAHACCRPQRFSREGDGQPMPRSECTCIILWTFSTDWEAPGILGYIGAHHVVPQLAFCKKTIHLTQRSPKNRTTRKPVSRSIDCCRDHKSVPLEASRPPPGSRSRHRGIPAGSRPRRCQLVPPFLTIYAVGVPRGLTYTRHPDAHSPPSPCRSTAETWGAGRMCVIDSS